MSESSAPETVPRRGRGRPPRISRDSIIEAARAISVDQLSMQSVADSLGVDRSTIHYHFADRDELFSVVASATLGAELAKYTPPESDDWRDWVAGYARSVYRALVRHGAIVLFVRLPLGSDAKALAPVEGVISAMLRAGFDEATVVHAIAYISEVVHAAAQNQILVSRDTHPQGVELVRYLDEQPADAVPGLRRLVEIDPLGHEDHFEFALKVLVDGLQAQLPTT
jgi:TetR/AcrR family transcriptional regulator, tetracycline repressor protein